MEEHKLSEEERLEIEVAAEAICQIIWGNDYEQ